MHAPSKIAIAASKWNALIVDALLAGCVGRLHELGAREASVEVHRVPGAFELPMAAKWLANTGGYDAIILIGCIIRGETYHFELVADACARGVQQVAIDSGIPCIFGVLAVDTIEQARARTGSTHGHAGIAAADAATEMIALSRSLKRSLT